MQLMQAQDVWASPPDILHFKGCDMTQRYISMEFWKQNSWQFRRPSHCSWPQGSLVSYIFLTSTQAKPHQIFQLTELKGCCSLPRSTSSQKMLPQWPGHPPSPSQLPRSAALHSMCTP